MRRARLVVGQLVDRIPGDRDCVLIIRKGRVEQQRVLLEERPETCRRHAQGEVMVGPRIGDPNGDPPLYAVNMPDERERAHPSTVNVCVAVCMLGLCLPWVGLCAAVGVRLFMWGSGL